MHADLDDERLQHLIVNSDAAQGFELLKNKILESCIKCIVLSTWGRKWQLIEDLEGMWYTE